MRFQRHRAEPDSLRPALSRERRAGDIAPTGSLRVAVAVGPAAFLQGPTPSAASGDDPTQSLLEQMVVGVLYSFGALSRAMVLGG